MADIVLNVEVRERTGTGGARVTRRAGMVPGVLYGGDKEPGGHRGMRSNEFRKALYTGKLLGHLVTLKYGSETQPVIAKAVRHAPGHRRADALRPLPRRRPPADQDRACPCTSADHEAGD